MTALMRATQLLGLPVVTLAGEDVAQVKDVVYAEASHEVAGFTLAGRGVLAGPLGQALPWSGVHAVGRDAVMISGVNVFTDRDKVAVRAELRDRDTLGDTVMTDTGTALGTVTDVILEVGSSAEVVGYEISAGAALPPAGRRTFLPVPATAAVSGEALIVPEAVTAFVADDLAGFGAAIRSFRSGSEGGR